MGLGQEAERWAVARAFIPGVQGRDRRDAGGLCAGLDRKWRGAERKIRVRRQMADVLLFCNGEQAGGMQGAVICEGIRGCCAGKRAKSEFVVFIAGQGACHAAVGRAHDEKHGQGASFC